MADPRQHEVEQLLVAAVLGDVILWITVVIEVRLFILALSHRQQQQEWTGCQRGRFDFAAHVRSR